MMKQPVKTLISFILSASLLLGCYSLSLDMVEVKALFVSADILNKNPLLNHYLDIAKLAEYIVTSFYIKQNVENGKIPKKSSDDPFGKHTRSDNRATSFFMFYEFKDVSNSLKAENMFNLAVDVGFWPGILYDMAIYNSRYDYMRVNERCVLALCAIQCFVAPRSDVNDLTLKTNIF